MYAFPKCASGRACLPDRFPFPAIEYVRSGESQSLRHRRRGVIFRLLEAIERFPFMILLCTCNQLLFTSARIERGKPPKPPRRNPTGLGSDYDMSQYVTEEDIQRELDKLMENYSTRKS